MSCHECRPGLTMDSKITFTELTQPDGVTKYWKAEQVINSIFGSEVEGGICSYGKTKEQAEANLAKEAERLYESLWV